MGYKYKVLRRLPKGHKFENDPPHGLYCSDDEFIFVSQEVRDHKILVTFLHECLHGVWYHSGHTLNFRSKEEEVITESTAFAIHKIMEQLGLLR